MLDIGHSAHLKRRIWEPQEVPPSQEQEIAATCPRRFDWIFPRDLTLDDVCLNNNATFRKVDADLRVFCTLSEPISEKPIRKRPGTEEEYDEGQVHARFYEATVQRGHCHER